MSADATFDANMNKPKEKSEMTIANEVRVPQIQDKEASVTKMMMDNYGLKVVSIKPLNGYDDLNFHIKTDSVYCNPHIDSHRPEGYFLKISNLKDSLQPEMLYAQRTAMDHLISKGIVCQDAIKGINGEVFTDITALNKAGDAVTYAASLRNFLPGKVIAGTSLSANLLFQIGKFAGEVTDAMQNFMVPFYETFDHTWSLGQLPKVSEVLFVVKDEKIKQICKDVISSFETQVLQKRNTFRKALIHGDLNEHNLLIDTDSSSNSGFRISGLLDFQDSTLSYPLYDIAICICYMLMTGKSEVPQEDLPGYMLAGYNSIVELPPAEKPALRACIAGRMVMSLVYGAYTYHLDPTNEYVLDTAKFGWKALTQFWEADPEKLLDRWDEIIQKYHSK